MMSAMNIKGVDVSLHGPYVPQQKEFMEACMECFIQGKNGILETANTGRTAALVSSSLSWVLQSFQRGLTKHILFLCGSEEELRKIIEEFNASAHSSMHMIAMKSLGELKLFFENHPTTDGEKVPTVIITTQHLFFQELMLGIHSPPKYNFQNTLVLIDDAFGVEEACRFSASLSMCKLDHVLKRLQDADNNVAIKLDGMKKLFRCIAPHKGAPYDPTYSGKEIKDIFQRCNAILDESNISILKKCENPDASEVLNFIYSANVFSRLYGESSSLISKFTENNLKPFTMYVTEISASELKKRKNHLGTCHVSCRTLHLLCTDPSILFQNLQAKQPHSILLSSSTISPFGPLIKDLGLFDYLEFVGKCVIEDFQVFARLVRCGSGGQFFDLPDNKCLDPDYKTSVGKSVLDVVQRTPAGLGLTIYFSSHDTFKQHCQHWHKIQIRGQSLWELIGREKDIFSADYAELQQFNTNVGHEKGKCIFTVLQKEDLEELINNSFNMDCNRVVMIIGVPFPSEDDPQVRVISNYNHERSLQRSGLTGIQFIRREAYKTIRRVLDHTFRFTSDFGVILLCDCQYDEVELSPWIKTKVIAEQRFMNMMYEMEDFFSSMERRSQWIMATAENPTQSIIQFGNVQTWEVEKVKQEFQKLRRKNNELENYLQRCRDSLKSKHDLKEMLGKKLKELTLELEKEPQYPNAQSEAGKVGDQITQQGGNLPTQGSPGKCVVSPGKMPQSPKVKCEAGEVGGQGILKAGNSFTGGSPKLGIVKIEAGEVGGRSTLQDDNLSIRGSPKKMSPSPRKRPYPENF